MNVKRISFSKAKTCVDGSRFNPLTGDDFRALTHLLEKRRMSYHSFALPEKKTTLRAGLKTFPVEIGLDEVKSDLVDQGLALLKVSE
ncbi:hypothetical protein MTP99_019739 [Tenebrio molitor]|jgi:hypothetical protein|nr:hypothetical protein MTP99_019739 [Tenebrio molitor]